MTQGPQEPSRTQSRRALEALRSGVPSRDAVGQLGCNHPDIEARFDTLLADVSKSTTSGAQARGLLVSGDFGSGKSHLLHYLEHRAIARGFACSKVVISKETPLSDPPKLFRAAAAELRVPGRVGTGLVNVAYALDARSDPFDSFFRWTDPAQSGLPAQFAGSLYVFQHGGDGEFRDRVVRFWSGDPLTRSELSQKLRLLGQQATYRLVALPHVRRLALDRFRFASRLIVAAGHRGWILLVDEVELIGVYSFMQRARAYAEVARLLGRLDDSDDGVFPGLGSVLAITTDFDPAIISGERYGKNDAEMIGGRLRASPRDDDHILATRAERGMRTIRNDAERVPRLTADAIQRTYERIRGMYHVAFGWQPPALAEPPRIEGTPVMRQFVRRWITEWDLQRLYPADRPDVELHPLAEPGYAEDPDLGTPDEHE